MSNAPFCQPGGYPVAVCKGIDLCDCFEWPDVEPADEETCEAALHPDGRPCAACGKNPADGYASVWANGVESWYCHGDDGPSCYSGDDPRPAPPLPIPWTAFPEGSGQ